jgi:LCP family protein required for cell wall assembly
LVGLGVFLAVLSGVVVLGSKLLFSHVSDSINKGNFLGQSQPNPNLDGPLNMLLVGDDSRSADTQPDAHADTEVIVHVTAAHDKAYLVSIPRDLAVQAPPFPKSGYAGGLAKMTEAFFWGEQNGQGTDGGMQELSETIQQRFGITLNAAALVNFDGLQNVVDAMGGVDMCFDETVTSKHTVTDKSGKIVNIGDQDNPWAFGKPVIYKQGDCWKNMPGWAALDYSRQRYFMSLNDGDYGRQRHQQQVLRAILKKATSAGMITDPAKLSRVISTAGQTLTLDLGGVSLEHFVLALHNIGTGQLTTLRTNAGQFNGDMIDGVSYEELTQDSEAMFKAVVDDNLGTFVASHPDFVVPGT